MESNVYHDLAGHKAVLPGQRQTVPARCVPPIDTFVPFLKDDIEQSIPARFERQAAAYPKRIALKTQQQILTYEALNQAANRLARRILDRCGPGEAPIALLLESGAPILVAMLGVLKTGKCFVPLDPASPRARTAFMLENSQAGLMITNASCRALANMLAHPGLDRLDVDAIEPQVPTTDLELSLPPDTLAYVLYTSGSTGQPKGVVENHRNVLHNTMRITNLLRIGSSDRLTLLRTCSVAGGMRDALCALLNGATLCVFDLPAQGLPYLARWLRQERITIYSSVTTVFRHFVRTLSDDDGFPELRVLYVGGEPVYRRDVELYKQHFSAGCVFVNRLGTTEAGIIGYYVVTKDTPIAGQVVPIVCGLDDIEIRTGDLEGVKEAHTGLGEIIVRSRYLSLGYWRRPDLTRRAFLPDPHGGEQRLYRTGDLGRWLPDGLLEPRGRLDTQVKIRGNRIDTTAIEMALLDLAVVKEAVVMVWEDPSGDSRLVAYVVAATQPPPTTAHLRRRLAEILPDAMIPLAFVMLNALPLTPNGKIDRQALPPASPVRPDLGTALVAPGSPLETWLAETWADVLAIEQVGSHDNFLDLGGDSLKAGQVLARLMAAFGDDLPVSSLLRSLTVAEMAMVLVQHHAGDAEVSP